MNTEAFGAWPIMGAASVDEVKHILDLAVQCYDQIKVHRHDASFLFVPMEVESERFGK